MMRPCRKLFKKRRLLKHCHLGERVQMRDILSFVHIAHMLRRGTYRLLPNSITSLDSRRPVKPLHPPLLKQPNTSAKRTPVRATHSLNPTRDCTSASARDLKTSAIAAAKPITSDTQKYNMPQLTEHVTLGRREDGLLKQKSTEQFKMKGGSAREARSNERCDVPRPSSATRFRRMVERCRTEDESDDDSEFLQP